MTRAASRSAPSFSRFSAFRVFFAMVLLISILWAEPCLTNLGEASRGQSHCFASQVRLPDAFVAEDTTFPVFSGQSDNSIKERPAPAVQPAPPRRRKNSGRPGQPEGSADRWKFPPPLPRAGNSHGSTGSDLLQSKPPRPCANRTARLPQSLLRSAPDGHHHSQPSPGSPRAPIWGGDQ